MLEDRSLCQCSSPPLHNNYYHWQLAGKGQGSCGLGLGQGEQIKALNKSSSIFFELARSEYVAQCSQSGDKLAIPGRFIVTSLQVARERERSSIFYFSTDFISLTQPWPPTCCST